MTYPLSPILRGVTRLLLDFDGPVCSVFAGLPAADVADRMRADLQAIGHELQEEWLDECDPLALLSSIARDQPALATEADSVMSALELEATRSARSNPEIASLLEACAGSGRSVVIVSNNAGRAIDSYLSQVGFGPLVQGVVGRVPGDPTSMKPSPRLLRTAMEGISPTACVFLGDAVRDVESGEAAGVATIGYANKPGKAERLATAGAIAVVDSLHSVTEAVSDTPLPSLSPERRPLR